MTDRQATRIEKNMKLGHSSDWKVSILSEATERISSKPPPALYTVATLNRSRRYVSQVSETSA